MTPEVDKMDRSDSPRVAAVSGQCSDTASLAASIASSSGRDVDEVAPTTRMPSAWARAATAWPMLPCPPGWLAWSRRRGASRRP